MAEALHRRVKRELGIGGRPGPALLVGLSGVPGPRAPRAGVRPARRRRGDRHRPHVGVPARPGAVDGGDRRAPSVGGVLLGAPLTSADRVASPARRDRARQVDASARGGIPIRRHQIGHGRCRFSCQARSMTTRTRVGVCGRIRARHGNRHVAAPAPERLAASRRERRPSGRVSEGRRVYSIRHSACNGDSQRRPVRRDRADAAYLKPPSRSGLVPEHDLDSRRQRARSPLDAHLPRGERQGRRRSDGAVLRFFLWTFLVLGLVTATGAGAFYWYVRDAVDQITEARTPDEKGAVDSLRRSGHPARLPGAKRPVDLPADRPGPPAR